MRRPHKGDLRDGAGGNRQWRKEKSKHLYKVREGRKESVSLGITILQEKNREKKKKKGGSGTGEKKKKNRGLF